MGEAQRKALRNLKMGIYTPIVFGVIFIGLSYVPIFASIENLLAGKSRSFAVGAMLLFWGLNALIYFRNYVKTLQDDGGRAVR